MADTLTVVLSFKGKSVSLPVDTSNATLRPLFDEALHAFGLSAAETALKLILKGKQLRRDAGAADQGLRDGAKLMVMATRHADASAIDSTKADKTIRGFEEEDAAARMREQVSRPQHDVVPCGCELVCLLHLLRPVHCDSLSALIELPPSCPAGVRRLQATRWPPNGTLRRAKSTSSRVLRRVPGIHSACARRQGRHMPSRCARAERGPARAYRVAQALGKSLPAMSKHLSSAGSEASVSSGSRPTPAALHA